MLRYWFRLLCSDNCILKCLYEDMYESSVVKPNDKLNWACRVRNVNHVDCFMCEFKQRLKDNVISEMNTFLNESSKCDLYRYIFDNKVLQFYLDHPVNHIYMPYICKMRISAS